MTHDQLRAALRRQTIDLTIVIGTMIFIAFVIMGTVASRG
jgi:hypothetical protein